VVQRPGLKFDAPRSAISSVVATQSAAILTKIGAVEFGWLVRSLVSSFEASK
jgi:hypothetical protein